MERIGVTTMALGSRDTTLVSFSQYL